MPDIDYTAWRFWIDIAQAAGTIIIGVYVWMVNRKKAVEKRFAKIEAVFDKRCATRKAQIETLEKNGASLKMQLEHMPNHQDIKELYGRIDLLNGSLSELNGRLVGINRAVDLINEFLINQGGKGAHS